MSQPDKPVTLEIMEAKRLVYEYRVMSDDVSCLALCYQATLELVEAKPERLGELKERCRGLEKRIQSRLAEFERCLETNLHLRAEPGTAPNDGRTAASVGSGAGEGPSSVT